MSFWYENDVDDLRFWTNGEYRVLEPLLQEENSSSSLEMEAIYDNRFNYIFNRTSSSDSFYFEAFENNSSLEDSGYSSDVYMINEIFE